MKHLNVFLLIGTREKHRERARLERAERKTERGGRVCYKYKILVSFFNNILTVAIFRK